MTLRDSQLELARAVASPFQFMHVQDNVKTVIGDLVDEIDRLRASPTVSPDDVEELADVMRTAVRGTEPTRAFHTAAVAALEWLALHASRTLGDSRA